MIALLRDCVRKEGATGSWPRIRAPRRRAQIACSKRPRPGWRKDDCHRTRGAGRRACPPSRAARAVGVRHRARRRTGLRRGARQRVRGRRVHRSAQEPAGLADLEVRDRARRVRGVAVSRARARPRRGGGKSRGRGRCANRRPRRRAAHLRCRSVPCGRGDAGLLGNADEPVELLRPACVRRPRWPRRSVCRRAIRSRCRPVCARCRSRSRASHMRKPANVTG